MAGTTLVFVAGVALKDRKDPKWASAFFGPDGNPKYGERYVPERGGVSRLYAAAAFERSARDSDCRILMSGGTQKNADGETVAKAEICAEQLVREFGVPRERSIALTGPTDTLGNVEALANYLEERKSSFANPTRLILLTEDFHLPRFTLMTATELLKRHGHTKLGRSQSGELLGAAERFAVDPPGLGLAVARDMLRFLLSGRALPFVLVPISSAVVMASRIGSERDGFVGARYARKLLSDTYLNGHMKPREVEGIKALLAGTYDRSGQAAREAERVEVLRRHEQGAP